MNPSFYRLIGQVAVGERIEIWSFERDDSICFLIEEVKGDGNTLGGKTVGDNRPAVVYLYPDGPDPSDPYDSLGYIEFLDAPPNPDPDLGLS